MSSYVMRKCKVCGESSFVDKSKLYTGYELKCGHSQKDDIPVKSASIIDPVVLGRVGTAQEFKNFVDRVMSVNGANSTLRKY